MSAKPAAWESVYVFISSTFNDMHAERDYLVKEVFPRLYDWCERRRLRLVDIDLRWGVTETDATRNRNVVRACLERIDQCRPFFLCFLGQRYGWVPEEAEIAPGTFHDFPGLTEAVAKGRSVTDLEVEHAVLRPLHPSQRRAEHAFFYLRSDGYLASVPGDPPALRRIYADDAEGDKARQTELREVRVPASGRPRRSYDAAWNAAERTPEIALPLQCPAVLPENRRRWRAQWREQGGIVLDEQTEEVPPQAASAAEAFNRRLTQGRLDRFVCGGRSLGDVVFDDLTAAIGQRWPDHVETEYGPGDDLQRELDQQAAFLFAGSQGFVSRPDQFDAIDSYVDGPSDVLFVLAADAGLGKSTLLANWVLHWQQRATKTPGSTVHARFIGASDGSSTPERLQRYLARELAEAGKIRRAVPADPRQLRDLWPDLLAEAGSHGKTVLVIDGLNQMRCPAVDVQWLPRRLPPGVKLIVSLRSDDEQGRAWLASLAAGPATLATVRPLEALEDRRRLIREQLRQFLKELDERHIDAMVDSPGAGNPLYLKVVLSDLRVYGAFAHLGRKIAADYGDTPVSAFEAVLRRLESEPIHSDLPPGAIVPALFGLLAHARNGLSAGELAESCRLAMGMDPARKAAIRETVHLFLRQVRPFLARREGRYDFFYESLLQAARNRYVATQAAAGPPQRSSEEWHGLLARYFMNTVPLAGRAGREDVEAIAARAWEQGPARSLQELPLQLAGCRDYRRLRELLRNPRYLAARCDGGEIDELLADFGRLPESEREPVGAHEDFLRQRAHHLRRFPGAFFSMAWHEGPAALRRDVEALADAGAWTRPWLRTRRIATLECSASASAGGLRAAAQFPLHAAACGGLAPGRRLAVAVKELGRLMLIDLAAGRRLPLEVEVGPSRVAALACSPSADYVAAVHDDGRVDVVGLSFDAGGDCLAQRPLAGLECLLPEFDPPRVTWIGDRLFFQQPAGSLVSVQWDRDGRANETMVWSGKRRAWEFQGAAGEGEDLVAALSDGRDTWLIPVANGRAGPPVHRPGQVLQWLGPAGGRYWAAVYTDRCVEVGPLGDPQQRAARVTVDELPDVIAGGDGTLTWFDKTHALYRWSWQLGGPPERIEVEGVRPGVPLALERCGSEELLYLNASGCCRLVPANAGTARSLEILHLAVVDRQCGTRAVQLRGDGLWLLDGVLRRELWITREADRWYVFGRDGLNRILAARMMGQGFVIDADRGEPQHAVSIPKNITAVAGHPRGGHWLADAGGTVYFIDPPGLACRTVATLDLPRVTRGRVDAWGDLVVWTGMCLAATADNVDAVAFFRAGKPPGELILLGRRVFPPSLGVFQGLTYLPAGRQCVLFWNQSDKLWARRGTAEDFLSRRDALLELALEPGPLRGIRRSAGGRSIYLLNDEGILFSLAADTLDLEAVLPALRPFACLADDGSDSLAQEVPAAVVEGHRDVFSFELSTARGDDP